MAKVGKKTRITVEISDKDLAAFRLEAQNFGLTHPEAAGKALRAWTKARAVFRGIDDKRQEERLNNAG